MFNIYAKNFDEDKYILVDFYLATDKNLDWAAKQVCYGQTVANPNVRNSRETDELFENHCALIVEEEAELQKQQAGFVKIVFPVANFNFREDGLTQLLTVLLGGQCDISGINECVVADVVFPQKILAEFKGPQYGISGIRKHTAVYYKPLLLGILKPKIIPSAKILADMTEELIQGGCNLIKEDECMSSPACLPIEERVKVIAPMIKNTKVVFYHCITSDFPYLINRAKYVCDNGGNGIHFNFWNGLGSYKTIRNLELPLFIHYQSSGAKTISCLKHNYRISWKVLCYFASICGADQMHCGMVGGYGNYDENETLEAMDVLIKNNTLPTLSCGLHPGIMDSVTKKVNTVDYAAGAGGSIHGHAWGSKAGAMAMIQAINKTPSQEYAQAIKQWGVA